MYRIKDDAKTNVHMYSIKSYMILSNWTLWIEKKMRQMKEKEHERKKQRRVGIRHGV